MTEPVGSTGDKKKDKRKQTIIAVAAVLGVLLTYMLYRRSASSTASTAGTALPGTGTATDADATEGTALGNIGDQLSALTALLTPSTSTTPAPAPPIASTLTSPTGSGTYVKDALGTIYEVENDNTLFGLTQQQWASLKSSIGATISAVIPNPSGASLANPGGNNSPGYNYSTADNLLTAQGIANPSQVGYGSTTPTAAQAAGGSGGSSGAAYETGLSGSPAAGGAVLSGIHENQQVP